MSLSRTSAAWSRGIPCHALTALLLTVAATAATAGVINGGPVSGVWTPSGSPYIIEGDITVPSGESLVVEPGVTVYAQEGYGMIVLGTLQAVGTADAPILFTGVQDSLPNWRGIRFENTTTVSRLEHCTVEHGDQRSNYGSGGGIACINGTIEIKDSTVRENNAYYNGAGVYVTGSNLTVENCDIRNNLISGANSGEGGGIYCESTNVTITGNRIEDNDVLTFTYYSGTNSRGGGITLRQCQGLIEKNVIARNYLNHSGTAAESAGGGVYVNGGTPLLRGNTIVANEVHYNNAHGGGVYLGGYDAQLVDTIVDDNVGAGIYFDPGASTATVSHCDVYGNTAGAFAGPGVPAGLGVIVQTNHNGDPCDDAFNLLLDPLFVNQPGGDFHLQPGSPCIDAGDPDSPFDPDGTLADIGALYFDQGTAGLHDSAAGGPFALLLSSAPEPMTRATMIRYRNPRSGPVLLTVHDISGRIVRRLVHGTETGGVHEVPFLGRDDQGRPLPSGVYFYRLRAGDREENRRLTVLR